MVHRVSFLIVTLGLVLFGATMASGCCVRVECGTCQECVVEQEGEDPIIGQLIAVVKDKDASETERGKACLALGKRGSNAKRAVPEMLNFMKETLVASEEKGGEGRLKLQNETVALIAEGLGGIGADAKDSVPMLADLLMLRINPKVDDVIVNEKAFLRFSIASGEALGKIGTAEAFDALAKASTTGRLPAPCREGSVLGLGHLAVNKDSPLRQKAIAQLNVVAEISTEADVQRLARNLLNKMEGKKLEEDKRK